MSYGCYFPDKILAAFGHVCKMSLIIIVCIFPLQVSTYRRCHDFCNYQCYSSNTSRFRTSRLLHLNLISIIDEVTCDVAKRHQ